MQTLESIFFLGWHLHPKICPDFAWIFTEKFNGKAADLTQKLTSKQAKLLREIYKKSFDSNYESHVRIADCCHSWLGYTEQYLYFDASQRIAKRISPIDFSKLWSHELEWKLKLKQWAEDLELLEILGEPQWLLTWAKYDEH